MSSRSLAARFGLILSRNPEIEGLSDAQVQEFLELYAQVPSTVKADKRQLEVLLDESKDIARSIDDNVMPRHSITVQGFNFRPPSIVSDIPCQLEFRILPGSGQQIISILEKGTNKTVETSGILHPEQQSTFITTIYSPGSFVFTSEIYPFMSGQVTTTEALDTLPSGADPSPLLLPDSWGAGADSPRLAAKGAQYHQQTALQKAANLQGSYASEQVDDNSAISSASAASEPAHSRVMQLDCNHHSSKHVSDSADGVLLQPSEAGMLQLLSVPGAQQQCPAPQHVSYDKQLSRTGCRARRATWYDDELDREVQQTTNKQQLSSSVTELGAEPAHVVHAAGAISAESPDGDTTSKCAPSKPHDLPTIHTSGSASTTAAWENQHVQQQPATDLHHSAVAKGLESLGTSFFSLNTACKEIPVADHFVDGMEDEGSSLGHATAQECAAAGSQDPLSESSYDSACVAAMYEPLPSNSDQHSSSCSDEAASDTASQIGVHGGCSSWSLGESVHLLKEVPDGQCGQGGLETRTVAVSWVDQSAVDHDSVTSSDSDSGNAASRFPADVRLARWQQRQQDNNNGGAVNLSQDQVSEPPGARWTLGGKASFTAGTAGRQLKSTFTSTRDLPDCSSAAHMSNGASSRWVITGGLGAGGQHTSLEQATIAAAANTEKVCTSDGSYFDKHVLGSSRHTSSSLLGPGTYLLGSRTSSGAACLKGTHVSSTSTETASAHTTGGPALHCAASATHGIANSDDEPEEVRIRAQRLLRQQQAAAATAKQANHQQQRPSAMTSNGSISTAGSKLTSKRKKGRKVVAAAASVPEDKDRAAADARRREREEVEYAMWDKGSRDGTSEDEPSMNKPQTSKVSVAGNRHVDSILFSSTAEAARQLTKCRFKSCKLMFASDLNKQRCHMSHLPSARNTTTKVYKTEVLDFLRALPEAAVWQLLQLPEPSQLPRRKVQLQELMQQYSRGSKAGSLILTAASSKNAAAVDRLQGMSLADAWSEQSTLSEDASAEHSSVLLLISRLAQVCCSAQLRPDSPGDGYAVSQNGKSGSSAPSNLKQSPPSDSVTPAAAALATAHVEAHRGACCARCSSETAHVADKIFSCTCDCHTQTTMQPPPPSRPSLGEVIALLERGSEGTWLCNPRLLQQPHPSGCCCSVCVGIVTADKADGKPGGQHTDVSAAVMESISSGLDVLDIFGEWNVDDASLSYAVERRLVTAFHRAKDAEAQRVMQQLLEDTEHSSSLTYQQSQALVSTAAGKRKDKKRAVKSSKAAVNQGVRKVPAWKAAGSDVEDGISAAVKQQDNSMVDKLLPEIAAADSAEQQASEHALHPIVESPSKGKYVAEQLLQAKLLQQDHELEQMRSAQQQQEQQRCNGAGEQGQFGGQCRVASALEVQHLQQQELKWQVKQPSEYALRSAEPLQRKCPPAQLDRTRVIVALTNSSQVQESMSLDCKPSSTGQRPAAEVGRLHRDMRSLHTRHATNSNSGSVSGAAAVLVVPRRRAQEISSSGRSEHINIASHRHVGCSHPSEEGSSAASQAPRGPTGQPTQPAATDTHAVAPTANESAAVPACATSDAWCDTSTGNDVIAADSKPIAVDSDCQQQVSSGSGQAATAELVHSSSVPGAQVVAETTMASESPAASDVYSHQHDNNNHQQQQQHMLRMLFEYQHHQAMLLQQHCMAFAQQQAYQHVFLASGRAAAVAAGQEILPFSAEEQQLMGQWCTYCYQHALVAASQQMLQQQQELRSTATAEAGDSNLDQYPAPVIMEQQHLPSPPHPAADHQPTAVSSCLESPLQFGSFPADFMLSPDADSRTGQPSSAANGAETAALSFESTGPKITSQPLLQQSPTHQHTSRQLMPAVTGHLAPVSQVPGGNIAARNSSRQTFPFKSLRISCDSGGFGDSFDAQMAQELLEERWTAVVADLGQPQRRISKARVAPAAGALHHTHRLPATAEVPSSSLRVAAHTLDVGSSAAVCVAAADVATRQGLRSHFQRRKEMFRHQGGRGLHHADGSSSNRVHGVEEKGRPRQRSSSSVWRPKQH